MSRVWSLAETQSNQTFETCGTIGITHSYVDHCHVIVVTGFFGDQLRQFDEVGVVCGRTNRWLI